MNPTGDQSVNTYNTLANSNADIVDGKFTYITTTEDPSIEYISNNKFVIVKPSQNKQTYQTTTYKSILDDILPFFWQSESDNGIKTTNKTDRISENSQTDSVTKKDSDISNLHYNNFNDYGTQKVNYSSSMNKNQPTTADDALTDEGGNNFNSDYKKTKKPDKNGSGEDLFSSLLQSFSSMYSSMDAQKQNVKPGNKNNVRIKPIVSHNPAVKTTNGDATKHTSYSNLGTFSSSTVKTTTLFIPILRYNSTATKYYSVLETTPVLANKNALPHHVQEDLSVETSSITRTEMYNRVTQPPQMKHVVEKNRHKVDSPTTNETFLVTSKPDSSETTYSYFQPSEILTDKVTPNHSTSTTDIITDSRPQKNYNYYVQETLDNYSSKDEPDLKNKSQSLPTTGSYNFLPTRNKTESLDNIQSSTKTYFTESYDTSIQRNKTTPAFNKITHTTEKEPDLFSELLGNFFAANDHETVASNSTKQTTTKAPITNVMKNAESPAKDDYEDNFSFDSFLSSWFNDETTLSSTAKPPKQVIESRIDTNVDDTDSEDMYNDDYNGEIQDDKSNLKNTTAKQEYQEKVASKEESIPLSNKEKVITGTDNIATDLGVKSTENRTSLKFDNVTEPNGNTKLKDDDILVNIRKTPENQTNYGGSNSNQIKLEENSPVVKDNDKLHSSNDEIDEDETDQVGKNSTTTPNVINKNVTKEFNKELHPSSSEKLSSLNRTSLTMLNVSQTITEKYIQQTQTDKSNTKVNNLNSQIEEVTKSPTTITTPDSTTEGNVHTTGHYQNKNILRPDNTVVQANENYFVETGTLSSSTVYFDTSDQSAETLIPIQTASKPLPSHSGYKPHQSIVPMTYRFNTTTPRATQESYRLSTSKPSEEPISTTRRYFPSKRPSTHSYRPSTYRPKVKFPLPSRPSSRPTGAPPVSTTPAFNPLKIDECNIYGSIYKVGTSIAELSTECLNCLCTNMGVQCSSRCLHV